MWPRERRPGLDQGSSSTWPASTSIPTTSWSSWWGPLLTSPSSASSTSSSTLRQSWISLSFLKHNKMQRAIDATWTKRLEDVIKWDNSINNIITDPLFEMLPHLKSELNTLEISPPDRISTWLCSAASWRPWTGRLTSWWSPSAPRWPGQSL